MENPSTNLVLEINETCYRLRDNLESDFKDFGPVSVQRTGQGDFLLQGNRNPVLIGGVERQKIKLENGMIFTVGKDRCRCFAWTPEGGREPIPTLESSTESDELTAEALRREDRRLMDVLEALQHKSRAT